MFYLLCRQVKMSLLILKNVLIFVLYVSKHTHHEMKWDENIHDRRKKSWKYPKEYSELILEGAIPNTF